ncbi:DUF4428 domain-containing protein [Shouchella lehensis]|uniref:SHOCT domain-containing protein n=1 Tax=Shouchella lehensis G1 TaxID=1246626 RepID=A0A060LR84_9BACI|nr:DUF4428 domain-containing protein [Shouchella lehensis]AIC93796.1 hypothetical protein BleG1_1193 [Shouchella lehensis G1]
MGFFDLKAICAVCDGEAGLHRYRIANKEWVCPTCYKKAGSSLKKFIAKATADEIREAIAKTSNNSTELDHFKATKKIGTLVEFDDYQKKWLVLSEILGRRNRSIVYRYEDILDFELLDDGESIASGGQGRAPINGGYFSHTGTMAGGLTGKRRTRGVCNSLQIKVTMNDINDPVVYIHFLKNAKSKRDEMVYRSLFEQAQECVSTFQVICDRENNQKPLTETAFSVADEIKKFKELLDDGIITEEEFHKKKLELLR